MALRKLKPNGCQICGRTLTDPASIARGIGPDCITQIAAGLAAIGTTLGLVAAIRFSQNINAARWALKALQATAAGRRREAASFLERAQSFYSPSEEECRQAEARFLADPNCERCQGRGTVSTVPEFGGDEDFADCECVEGK